VGASSARLAFPAPCPLVCVTVVVKCSVPAVYPTPLNHWLHAGVPGMQREAAETPHNIDGCA